MRQIVAMGGGGFSMEPENPLLDRYVLGLTGKDRPKVCFLPTASGDAEGYIINFYRAMVRLNAEPTHLSLLHPTERDMAGLLLAQDVIYVGGGNTKNMLALWRAWGLDEILRTAWERGVVLAGLSAGSICWFEQGVTDSVPGELSALPALGFLKGSHCPHYDGEPERRPAYHRLRAAGLLSDGIAADDGVGLHYVGDELAKVVSSRPGARAYRVYAEGGAVREEPIVPQCLGA
ncbi:peptidase E [Symbiobacterium terraclitae]|uniref:Peptidase E n=1 Tax=Symbiobacterium terraclitae TaxID=557451 RepID=A0ABS4JRV9_9FIRM|nr:peptidase E [Symbiobacterium terraclitae]MBP2018272.1 peptidase E [Symbiobacterium terraclitae]